MTFESKSVYLTLYHSHVGVKACLHVWFLRCNCHPAEMPALEKLNEGQCAWLPVSPLPMSHPGNLHIECAKNTRNTREIHATRGADHGVNPPLPLT